MQRFLSTLRQLFLPESPSCGVRPAARTPHVRPAVEELGPRVVLSAAGVRVENPLWFSNGELTVRKVLPGGTQGDGQCLGRGGTHKGMDFLADEGTAVHAAAGNGVVVRVRRNWKPGGPDAGNMVILQHQRPGGGTFLTKYFHLRDMPRWLKPGTPVRRGQVIGHVGRTGNVVPGGDTHLHFEVWSGNRPVCPDIGPGRLALSSAPPLPGPPTVLPVPLQTYHITGVCPDGTFGVLATGVSEADLPTVLADFQARGCAVRGVPDTPSI